MRRFGKLTLLIGLFLSACMLDSAPNTPPLEGKCKSAPSEAQSCADAVDSVPEVVDSVPEVVDSVPEVVDSVPDVIDSVPEVVDSVPVDKNSVFGMDSSYFDTTKFMGDFSPIAVGNWWKYSSNGTSEYDFESTYEIIEVDTPNVILRFKIRRVSKISMHYLLETISTVDTVVLDTTFSVADSANFVFGESDIHLTFPLYQRHYVETDMGVVKDGTSYTTLDLDKRQIQYKWYGSAGTLTQNYSAGIGLVSSGWQGVGRGGGGSFQYTLIDQNIKGISR